MGNDPIEEDFLIEAMAVIPINFDGIGPINIRDGMVYVTFWARQQKVDGSGFERIVVGRIVSRYAAVQDGIFQMDKAMARAAVSGNSAKPRWEEH